MKNIWDNEKIIKTIEGGGVVVMPTDTIYGIVGSALKPNTVERIYDIRKREKSKPCIILIGDIKELKKFNIELSLKQLEIVENYWPGPVSIVLDCEDKSFFYLNRGTKTLSFRLPALKEFQGLLLKTGPIIAPSANTEGLPPAEDIAKAKEYFGNSVDFYVDGGNVSGKASKVIKLHKDGSITILRE